MKEVSKRRDFESAMRELESTAKELNEVRGDLRRKLKASFTYHGTFMTFCEYGRINLERNIRR